MQRRNNRFGISGLVLVLVLVPVLLGIGWLLLKLLNG